MIKINFIDWQNAPTDDENLKIRSNRDCFIEKLKTFDAIKNGTGSVSFSNNDPEYKFVFVCKENNSSHPDEYWLKFLQSEFLEYLGG